MISFVKYQGTGNDFIIIDDRLTNYELSTQEVRELCDRHFGIGADGLIQMRNHTSFDFEMRYYNSDGLPGSMCGNGGRCAVAFANTIGIIGKSATFIAFDGAHEANILSVNPYVVSLKMNDVLQIEKASDHLFLNTGSPHYVIFTRNVSEMDVVASGRKIRYSEQYKSEGTNVNFAEVKNDGLYLRTYERGVEDETLSCGTGVTATVLAAAASELIPGDSCIVDTPGGKLKVRFKKHGNSFSDIWLEGRADYVFSGNYSFER